MLKINKRQFSRPAFSLIEIMAVLLIVALGMVGTANLAVQILQAQTVNRSSIIAYQLAQEGIELARQIRDTNWLNDQPWLTGFSSDTYCLDYRNEAPRSVGSSADCFLYLNADGWYYAPATPAAEDRRTDFSRVVVVEAATSSASVKSIVSWHDRERAINYEVETILYDWY